MSIQTTLKKFLRDRNMTQAQFAELAGLNPCGLSKFLNREDGESIAERVYPYLHESKNLTAAPSTPTEPEEVNHGLAPPRTAGPRLPAWGSPRRGSTSSGWCRRTGCGRARRGRVV